MKLIQKQLFEQWAVLETLTPSEYEAFRPALGSSSGFQSAQYRALEFLLGNKQAALLDVFRYDAATHAELTAILRAPSLYDEFLRHLARRGLPVPAACVERDWSQPYVRNPDLVAVFKTIYDDPESVVGRLRDGGEAGRRRGVVPALALPAPEDSRAHHRPQARDRRLVGRRVPEARARPHVLSRADRRAHGDRPEMSAAGRRRPRNCSLPGGARRVAALGDQSATVERIEAAVAALPTGPLTEDGIRSHVAPLFSRVLAAQRDRVYLANHSLGRPLDATEDDVREGLALWAGMGDAWDAWDAEMAAWRARLAALMGAPRPDCVVPKTSAGQGLRAVLNATTGVRRVVATRGEFDSLDVILREYAHRGRIALTLVEPA